MAHSESGDAAGGHAHGVGHIVPVPLLAAVLIALLILTLVTVAATWVDLGRLNIWIAMGIATVKAALVILYFMHLRYDRPFNAIILASALLFVFLFLGLATLDTHAYQSQVDALRAADPTQYATARPNQYEYRDPTPGGRHGEEKPHAPSGEGAGGH